MEDRNGNRPGYKKTMAGLIPQEWKCQPFGSILEMSQYGLSESVSDNGKIPILRMSNVDDGKVTYRNLGYVDIPDKVQTKYLVSKNDLLFNRTNSLDLVGKTGIVTQEQTAVFASYLIRFRLKESSALPTFVNYLFSTAQFRKKLKRLATPGVSQYNINQSELVSIRERQDVKKIG